MSESAPPSPPRDAGWLGELPCRIGEIVIVRDPTGTFSFCHRDDEMRDDLQVAETAEAATALARFGDGGIYRPLKTAPNLRHGWKLTLVDLSAVRRAVDLFYPGRVAAYEVWAAGRLSTAPFRDSLARQTGMYRAAARIDDEQANRLIGNFCRSDGGCLRTILWRRDAGGGCPSTLLPPEKFDPRHDQVGRGERPVPLICQEICNLLVAAARDVVKSAS